MNDERDIVISLDPNRKPMKIDLSRSGWITPDPSFTRVNTGDGSQYVYCSSGPDAWVGYKVVHLVSHSPCGATRSGEYKTACGLADGHDGPHLECSMELIEQMPGPLAISTDFH